MEGIAPAQTAPAQREEDNNQQYQQQEYTPSKVSILIPKRFPRGYWQGEDAKERARQITRSLFEGLSDDEILGLSSCSFFAKKGLGGMLKVVYGDAYSKALIDAYPGRFKFKERNSSFYVPYNYWQGKIGRENARRAVRELFESFDNETVLQNVSLSFFRQHHLEGMIKTVYSSSPIQAVMDAYPGRFKPWNFRKLGNKYWQGQEGKKRAREAVRWLFEERLPAKTGNAFSLEQIPAIADQDIFENNDLAGALIIVYGCSPSRAVIDAYPGNFKPWQFARPPNNFWDGENQREMFEDAVTWYFFQRYGLSAKDIEKNNLSERLLKSISMEEAKLQRLTRKFEIKGQKLLEICKASPEYQGRLALEDLEEKLQSEYEFTSAERKEGTHALFDLYSLARQKAYPVRRDAQLLERVALAINSLNFPWRFLLTAKFYNQNAGGLSVITFNNLLAVGAKAMIYNIIPKYDSSKGELTTYMARALNNIFFREKDQNEGPVTVPEYVIQDRHKILKLLRQEEISFDESFDEGKLAQLAEQSGLSETRIKRAFNEGSPEKLRLDQPRKNRDGDDYYSSMPAPDNTETNAVSRELFSKLHMWLPAKSAFVLELVYAGGMTHKETAVELHKRGLIKKVCTGSMIQQIHSKALARLRKIPELQKLAESYLGL